MAYLNGRKIMSCDVVSGYSDGYSKGFIDGREIEHKTFWDSYLKNDPETGISQRGTFSNAFSGEGWNENTFKPNAVITPTVATGMFGTSGIHGDLTELGTIDFSNCTNFSGFFSWARYITRVGIIDASKHGSTGLNNAFEYNYALTTIDKLIIKDDGSTTFNNTFTECGSLENINIEGVIGQNIDFGSCKKLTEDSILAIVRVLSETATGKTLTLSLQAVNKAYETTEGANDGSTSEAWLGMAQGRSNWTITLK